MTRELCFLDGAMGTQLQAAGLKAGENPELMCLRAPDTVRDIHRSYLEAGSQVLYTNTFGANARKLAGTGASPAAVIAAAVALAKEAAAGRARVALDIGPVGELLEPLGTLRFDEAYEIYREMVTAGAAAGADLIVFETMSDLYEVKAAVLAAREHTGLPVWVTMTFEENRRTFLGVPVSAMALTLEGLGVDALGFNCSLGPVELLPMARELSEWTRLPMIIKANAGLPDPATGAYSITPEAFARAMEPYLELGFSIFGGCCGTTPDFIRALRGRLAQEQCTVPAGVPRRGVCSGTETVELSGVRVIGERINPTGKKRFQQALRERDFPYIQERGLEQAEAGADILDVNVGLPGLDEAAMMAETVKALQGVLALPLQIDASDSKVIEAGLRYYNGKPIVNSVNGSWESLDAILPLCRKYGAAVVGLTMDEGGIPQTAEARFAIAQRILEAALSYGLAREDVFIDCLTLTVSAQQAQAGETLRALRRVREELGLHTVLGVSNISFGLPERAHITESFLTQAMCCGLDLPIINPNQRAMMDAVSAFRVLSGEDAGAAAYIRRFAGAGEEKPASVPTAGTVTLREAIARGLKEEAAAQTRALLMEQEPLEIVNRELIPALDAVGDGYERQEIFLPQLIQAANAACAGFEVIRSAIAESGGARISKRKIVVATVQGDIHDIGKNIVKVVLENYGYQVVDLGRDVPVQTVAEAVVRENVALVGLSALMTTTVGAMAETIRAIRDTGHPCKIWVGGAVLTPEYAAEIGADFYAKDAKASVDIAKAVLG